MADQPTASPGNPPALVLVTGANGHIGYGIVLGALRAGYSVRAAVRRPAAADVIRSAPSVSRFLNSGALSIIQVADQSASGAYTDAVRGCRYIVHVASPLPNKIGPGGDIVAETVDGVKRILEAAERTASVRRVVFTSSIYAVADYRSILDDTPTPGADVDTRLPLADMRMHEQFANVPHLQYNLAKAAAKQYTEDYIKSRDPVGGHVSIVNILPGFVLGPSEVLTNQTAAYSSSNGFLAYIFMDLAPLLVGFLGTPAQGSISVWSCHTHIDDCVDAHVRALDEELVKGRLRNFLVVGGDGGSGQPAGGSPWNEATDTVKRELPDIAKEIKFVPCTLMSKPLELHCGTTEQELLGRRTKSYREQVLDSLPWLLNLSGG